MIEIWKDISGYEGYYQVSNLGRVKSLSRFKKNGKCGYIQKERILKQTVSTTGYMKVELYIEKSKRSIKVHRLVADAFLDNTENKPDINHKNGDKFDNHLKNLEWCTEKENVNHAIKTGLKKIFKLNKEELCELYFDQELNQKEIGDLYGVSNATISKQLKEHSLPVRNSGEAKTQYNITEETLDKELSIKSQSELAKDIGCDASLVSYYYNLFKKKGA